MYRSWTSLRGRLMKIFSSFRNLCLRLVPRRGLTFVLGIGILLASVWGTLHAQGLSGITGTITDPSGAVVPGAKVTVTNTGTNISNTAITTSAGTYTITDLIPGTYKVRVEAPGFASGLLSDVHVDVSRYTNADVSLKTGVATETVEVVAEQIALETTQPQLGTIVENKLVEEVPILIGGGPGNIGARDRQIDDYLFIAPGVQGGEFSHRINGGVDFENEVMFNGVVANQSETQGLQSNINPPFEMVSEIQVLTSNFSAQYGLAQGVASYQFASGTNTLHGDAFEINRNTMFNAAGANPSGTTSTKKGPTPPLHQNSFGFSLGGPVWIPKLYSGRNKTFFHFSADWFRQNIQDQGTYTVPTPAEAGGDFSGYVNGQGVQIPIFVPQGFVAPSGCTAPAPGQQWPGNKIPTSCFSATSASLLKLIPAPSFPGLLNNALSHIGVLPIRQTNWGFSIDHNLTDKQKLHGSFWRDKYDLTSCCNTGIRVNNPLSGKEEEPRLGTGLFLTYSNAISNNLVMTAGFGWMGEINNELNSFLGFTFNSRTTADPANIGTTGSAFASYLLGYADATQRQFAIENRLRNFYIAPYIQDDIKVSSRLTVNVGLRWDLTRPFTENHDNVLFFDPTVPNPGAATPAGTPLLGAANKLGTCSVCAGYSRADMRWKNFSPRFGFAYKLDPKTVVLSGFALNFLDGGSYEYGDNKIAVNYGSLLGGIFNVNSLGSNVSGYGQWDGRSIPQPAASQFTDRSFLNSTGALRQFGRDPGKIPYTEAWNAGIQRELPGNMFLSVAYIGNRSLHLPSLLNPINQTNPKFLTQFCASGDPNDANCLMSPNSPNFAWTSTSSQAALQSAGSSQCPAGTPSAGLFAPYCNFMSDYGAGAGLPQALLPYSMYNPSESCGGICNNFDTTGAAFYNALQVQTQKRFSTGLSFLVSYTLSKTMSNTDTGFSTFNFGSENKFNQKS